MTEKYVKLSDVKKKLNYICRTYSLGQQIKQSMSDALAKIPCTVKGELETTLDVEFVKYGEWVYGENDIPRCSECGVEVKEISPFCPQCGAKMDGEDGENNGQP